MMAGFLERVLRRPQPRTSPTAGVGEDPGRRCRCRALAQSASLQLRFPPAPRTAPGSRRRSVRPTGRSDVPSKSPPSPDVVEGRRTLGGRARRDRRTWARPGLRLLRPGRRATPRSARSTRADVPLVEARAGPASATSSCRQSAHSWGDERRDERDHADAAVAGEGGEPRRRGTLRGLPAERVRGGVREDQPATDAVLSVFPQSCRRRCARGRRALPMRLHLPGRPSRPKSVSPPGVGRVGGRVRPADVGVVGERQVSARRGSAAMRRTPSDEAMACPPSAPSSDAIRPAFMIRSTSAARSAISRSCGYCPASPVHEVDLLEHGGDGAGGQRVRGRTPTRTCAATPRPPAARGRSVCADGNRPPQGRPGRDRRRPPCATSRAGRCVRPAP